MERELGEGRKKVTNRQVEGNCSQNWAGEKECKSVGRYRFSKHKRQIIWVKIGIRFASAKSSINGIITIITNLKYLKHW